jgi:hypothetical protein
MTRHIGITRRWRLLLAGCVSLAIIGACVAGAVLILTGSRSPYSQEQLEHVLAAIGSPPGFDQPGQLYIRSRQGGTDAVDRWYFGPGSSEIAMNWVLGRFRSLGLTNARRDTPAVVMASCGNLEASAEYDPHGVDPSLTGPAVTIEVLSGAGRVDGAPDCPPQFDQVLNFKP